jgi:NADH-quinone oxidoreductase subunit J
VTVGEVGMAFLSTHVLPFEIVSIHLLVVLIGAACLARAKKKANPQ